MTAAESPRGLALHWQILLSLLIAGIAGALCNLLAPPAAAGGPNPTVAWVNTYLAKPAGEIFLRLMFMVVLPLVFSALVLGITEIGDVRRLGRLGSRTLLWTVAFSAISVGIGLAVANGLRPGDSITETQRAELNARYATDAQKSIDQAKQAKTALQTVLDIIPRNPLQEAVGALDGSAKGGGMLAVMFFALIVGVGITLAPARTGPLVGVLEGVYDVSLVIVGIALRFAPLGVAGLIFGLTSTLGADVLRTLAFYVLAVVAGLAAHALLVYPLALVIFARTRPTDFMVSASPALMTAFATSSSNATLPTSLRVAEERLGLKRRVSRFVLTVGATANQNGTALYEGVTVLFLAQVFGVELSLGQQFTVALLSILAGIGTAGVPGGSLPLVVLVLMTVGIPPEGIGLILGVDRFLDMCRTTVNVAGDLAIATCVNRADRDDDLADA